MSEKAAIQRNHGCMAFVRARKEIHGRRWPMSSMQSSIFQRFTTTAKLCFNYNTRSQTILNSHLLEYRTAQNF